MSSGDPNAYTPPVGAIGTALGSLGLDTTLAWPAFAAVAPDDVHGVLDEFGRFAAEVLAPTDRVGDRDGARFDPATGSVTLPEPLAKAYRRYVEAGWGALAVPGEDGGGGFPGTVGLAVQEMLTAANMALSLNPILTQGAIHLLARWGTEAQRAAYLPRLVTGEWTGTMNLTEPDAGSDVGAVRTRAEPLPDGRWSLTGTKIFITWGQHDLADDIVHLVLARTPGAPPGTKGISLFVVPRSLRDGDGPVRANAVRCVGLEHKLGIHASPTCTMELDGAVGELVGPEHGGMAAMFTMMNAARLSIGLQGLAVGERAHQQALAFAHQRHQGRAPGAPPGTASPIVEHPDVRRMLMLTASALDAMRLLLYSTAAATDAAHHHPDPEGRTAGRARADLLTPIAKAWCTDEGVRVASLALQVHGGMGYVEETGIAQRYRDSRIGPIYEGTNGIQAIDLVFRKVVRDGGAALASLLSELDDDMARARARPDLAPAIEMVGEAVIAVRRATTWLLHASTTDEDRLAAATAYLDLVAPAVAGALMIGQADWAREHRGAAEADALAGRAAFFAVERVVPAAALLAAVTNGAGRIDPAHLG